MGGDVCRVLWCYVEGTGDACLVRYSVYVIRVKFMVDMLG